MVHELVHTADAGNGYHGYCKHCGLPLVTDLGYCSWDDVICVPIDREKEAKERELEAETNRVYKMAYEYFRFLRNWGKEFDREGWAYIRGTAEPLYMEVKKTKNKYKFDKMSEDIIKHILLCPYNKDDLLILKDNKLVFKI